jgi:hypothetical protein
MKYCINPEECKKENIPIDTLLFSLSLYLGKMITPDTFQDVCSRGFIEYDGFDLMRQPINPKLTPTGVELVESILLNSEFTDKGNDDARYTNLAEKLIELFPKGRKEGTNYMWRDSKALIAKRLKAIVKKYGVSFTDEEAVEATQRYVSSFNGDYRYMQLLKYFLMKKNLVTGEENSQFLSYLENKESSETNLNWMDNVR